MRLLAAALACAIATASAPCALELRIDSTDVTSLFDATANATAVADDLADRAGGSLAQGAGCDDLAKTNETNDFLSFAKVCETHSDGSQRV